MASLSQHSLLVRKKKLRINYIVKINYVMHKQPMNLKGNHTVLQHLEIEKHQQIQACAPSQHFLPLIFCYLPHSLPLTAPYKSLGFLSGMYLLPWFSTAYFMYPSNASFLPLGCTVIHCTLTLRKPSWTSTIFSLFFFTLYYCLGFFHLRQYLFHASSGKVEI